MKSASGRGSRVHHARGNESALRANSGAESAGKRRAHDLHGPTNGKSQVMEREYGRKEGRVDQFPMGGGGI